MDRRVSIFILNYNGRDLLEEYLPSVMEAVEYDSGGHEIVVVDNLSTDDSVEFVERNFPGVCVKRMEVNRLFFSYNRVVKECKNDYIILLNTDVKVVEPHFVSPLLRHFSDPDVFAVMPKVLSDNPSAEYLCRCPGVFWRGFLKAEKREKFPGADLHSLRLEEQPPTTERSFWNSVDSMIFITPGILKTWIFPI